MKWFYEMLVDIMAYASGELIKVMSMDLTYFEQTAPVIITMVDVFVALGWALLMGNLVFQSLKSIVSGIGFESEDPKIIFARTFVFTFLLLCSRQICEIAMGITSTVIELLQIPTSLEIVTPDESMFSLGSSAKWLLVIIVGIVLMFQLVKLLFEIGERYVVTSVLTFFAPLAFAMGGSKNTNDIFKGWCRMYGSMMIMMIMNIVFLKLILSAMTRMTSGGVLVWLVFIVALTRVARKIDSHIGKIGLNPAQTGDSIGGRLPGMMTMIAVRTLASTVGKSINANKGGSGGKGGSGSKDSTKHSGNNGGNSWQNSYARKNSSHSTNNAGAPGAMGSTTSNNSFGSNNTQTSSSANNPQAANNAAYKTAMQKSGNVVGTSSQPQKADSNDNTTSNPTGADKNRPPLSRNTRKASTNQSIRRSGGNQNTTNYGRQNNSGDVLAQTRHSKSGNNVFANSNDRKNSLLHQNDNMTVDGKKSMNNSSSTNNKNNDKRVNKQNNSFDNTQQNLINHEYKQGRYNPASVNKKSSNRQYTKQLGMKPTNNSIPNKKRGGRNRKEK